MVVSVGDIHVRQVALKDDRAFAHFLFGLSATFTRLGSLASFGNDDDSITPLRYLGYVLSKTAQTLQPKLFAEEEWARVNKSFLDRNDCAALLRAFQLNLSKALDAGEFQRFVPQVYQDPGLRFNLSSSGCLEIDPPSHRQVIFKIR
jgi:hypothetical protein